MIHQCQPHLDYLVLNEVMLVDLDNIGNATIVSMLTLKDLEVVVIINVAHYWIINHCTGACND